MGKCGNIGERCCEGGWCDDPSVCVDNVCTGPDPGPVNPVHTWCPTLPGGEPGSACDVIMPFIKGCPTWAPNWAGQCDCGFSGGEASCACCMFDNVR